MKIIITLHLILLVNYRLQAQNYLLNRSESASFLTVAIGKESDALYNTGTVGYSMNGKFDMALVGTYESGNKVSNAYTITPSFSYLFIKQNKIPFSLGAFAGYGFKNFTRVEELKNHTIKSGLSLYHKIILKKNVSLIPGTYVGIDFTKATLDNYQNKFTTHSAGIQSTLLLKNFSISPSLVYTERRGYAVTLQLSFLIFKRDYIESIY